MKYIIDIDAFKDCLDLIESPVRAGVEKMVRLSDVKSLIDKFPKDEIKIKDNKTDVSMR